MRHRYFLTIAAERLEVFPYEAHKLKLVTAREKDQIFYRTKLTGEAVFVKSDFDLLLAVEQSAERCLEIGFEIEKKCSGVWEVVWKGYFSCNDVKWDLSKCDASVTPLPDDEYRSILENYSKEYNVLPGTTPVSASVKLDLEADFEFLFTNYDEQPVQDAGTWAEFIHMNYWVDPSFLGGDHFNGKIWFRMLRRLRRENGVPVDLSGGGWSIVAEYPETDEAKYAKAPDLYQFKPFDWNSKGNFTRYPELLQIDCGAAYDTSRYINVTALLQGVNLQNGCLNMFRKMNEDRYVQILWDFGTLTYSRNRAFTDIVRRLVELTATPDLLPASDVALSRFFNDELNYVTEAPNSLRGMHVASLSDVVGYNSSEPATKADWSLKKLLDTLRSMFRVYWDIEQGKIRLEHESFYQLQGEKDLTVHEKHLRGTKSYEYVKEDMPRFQRLLFSNAFNQDFEKGEIEYGGVCVTKDEGKDTDETTITEVTTDLEYLITSGGNTGQKGFVFMLISEGQVLKERGDLSGLFYPNAGLSAANLVKNYYTHNRVLENGAVNRIIRIFKSVKKTRKQATLTVPVCCEKINPFARFISTLSANAELESMSYNLITGDAELVLLHDTTGTGHINLGRQFDDSFDDSFR
ncbi:hypothetical protein [Pontibacter beigongshangensis]|uniref:hypothetical protein n=1 Tax=Pontibacter beigongshangensis TaxID=2574733 RepID=UPI0016509D89|nr:hypothetical protein [Pontibacter beigongshangensis]